MPVVRKLIHNQIALITHTEWQNLFHDIHMICSWDVKGCYKLLEALEFELKEFFIFNAKSKIASISDPQQKLREYMDSWCQYTHLLLNFPLAFQQLDLAAKDIIPLPPLAESESPDSSLSLWLKNEKRKVGAVSCVLLYHWNVHIVKPFVKHLQENYPSAAGNSVQTSASRFAELLANYCDLLLRKNAFSKKLTAEDITNHLMGISNILKFTNDKEAFLKSYRHHLVRRLILDAANDLKTEEWFVNNLKVIDEMPNEPLYRFSRMIHDTKTSFNIQNQFRKSIEHIENINNNNSTKVNDNNNTDCANQMNNNVGGMRIESNDLINIKVLNPSAWTKQDEKTNIFMDEKFNSIIASYEAFYCDIYEGRQLNWCNQISNGILAFNSSKGKFDLEVNASQLSVLSCFNSKPNACMSFEELAQEAHLSTSELRKTIWVSS